MTVPGVGQAPHSQLDLAALAAVSSAQRLISGQPRLPISREEREELEKVAADGGICRFCAGIHAGSSTPACPRLAGGKLNGDGDVVEFTYWPSWDASRVIYPEDVDEESEDVSEPT
jgi:hypothetical protein